MPRQTLTVEEIIEKKAETEGDFAIAYALLSVSQGLSSIASSLNRLGLGNASTDMGAMELLASEVKRIAESVEMGLQVKVESD